MPLTTQVNDSAWSQLTPSAGTFITLAVDDVGANFSVFFIVATSAPSDAKRRPAEGDNAFVQKGSFKGGLPFRNLESNQHIYARTERGSALVYVTTAI